MLDLAAPPAVLTRAVVVGTAVLVPERLLLGTVVERLTGAAEVGLDVGFEMDLSLEVGETEGEGL